ncbi:MAG: TonB-dependent receptor [Altibacter sp.]|uniref:TonB-dependent receptor n=1 Tax=Altibacter sp. TaxID=2024823 RepID=UPI001D75D6C2|nr:TonB-dependent receptor [Altibacter sp.]MBZ0326954.1 TonB-dependent receptor [Altibacter sp.]
MQKKATSTYRYVFIGLFYVFWGQLCTAQDHDKIALQTVIENMETKYSISVSYTPDAIAGITITPPSPSFSLDDLLIYLNENTPLVFTSIDARYVTVTFKDSEKVYCGRILDASSGFPLEGATVQTNNNKYATITNAEGVFYISENANITSVLISYVGFESYEIPLQRFETNCPTFLLIPSVTRLEYITLNALFTKGIVKELNGSISLNTDNFGLLPGQVENDVLQIAQALPGVESVDETISNINIRGGTHDENLILWDDIKMYQSGHFFGLISAFNPDLTERVSIYKNGTPAKYGESASGVIAMYSKNTVSNTFTAGGGFNLINANVFADVPVSENFSMQVSGRHSLSFLVETPVYNTFSERIFQDTEITNRENPNNPTTISTEVDFNFYDASAKLLWDVSDKDKFRLNFLIIENHLHFDESVEASMQSKRSQLGQTSTVGGISWKRIWDSNFETTVQGYGSSYLIDSINKDILTSQEQQQENEVLETGIKLETKITLSDRYSLESGYHFSETGISNTQDVNLPRFRSVVKNVLQSHVLFGTLNYTSPNDQTIINGGVRMNYLDKFSKFIVEPRLSFHQKMGGGFAFEALGEFKNQSVTQRIDFTNDFLGIENRRWVLADDQAVPVIQSKQASAGVVYKRNNWFVNLEGFYKFVDGITSSNQGFQNQFQSVQTTGSYTAKGAEFTLNKKIRSFSAWFTYLYMKNDYTFDSLSPSTFPNNLDIRHSLTTAGSYSFKNFKIALGYNYRTGKPNTFPLAGEEIIIEDGAEVIQFDTPNNERTANYFRTDLSVEYLWEISSKVTAKINAAVLNVFNTKNTLNIRYTLDTDSSGNSRVNQVKEVSLGVTPNFSLQLLF